ncbi:hypothetical protein JTE90_014544 [Oedothorax gibbosus]|uniref:Uncharacterized protein n=1 Tax=Oedothorax gibbosus TaxID=931172 RepID=A0AAV6TPF9_9ARAC|nr:hypothetical protein JTE90_014544 [Oedothorax gibbosus]
MVPPGQWVSSRGQMGFSSRSQGVYSGVNGAAPESRVTPGVNESLQEINGHPGSMSQLQGSIVSSRSQRVAPGVKRVAPGVMVSSRGTRLFFYISLPNEEKIWTMSKKKGATWG